MHTRTNHSLFLLTTAVLTLSLPPAASAQTEPFALGADISWLNQRENPTAAGGGNTRYYIGDAAQAQDMLAILKDYGFNYIRLRLFVDPTAKVPEDVPDASGWSASPYSARGYCGLDSTIKYAKKVKAAGFKFLLDFHYSDTWADPGKQYKPVSWRNITFAQLTDSVRIYTQRSVQKFKDNGVLPDMVQVGNEVVAGMIHPDGNGNSANFARLVNAGISGVKAVDPNIKIMMHTISERNPNGWVNTLRTNLNNVEANAANKIDVIGLSYYPRWHGDRDSLRRVLTAISNNTAHNYKLCVVEYADYHREVNDLVYALPANRRFGTFVWEPQEFAGDDSKPLFDWRNNGRRSNARLDLYPVMAKAYNPTTSVNRTQAQTTARQNDFHVRNDGIVSYYSNRPGTITIYTMQGRMAGRLDVRSPGTYDPARLSKTPLRPGMYIVTVEPIGSKRGVFSCRVTR